MTDVFIEVESVKDVEIVLSAVTGGLLPDGIVENTDESYSDTVANGSTLVIPDINITKNDDSVVTSPAAIDLDLRIIDPATTPSGWDDQIAAYGRGYNYPPSSPTTVYRIGDDADIEDTIFAPIRVANSLKVQNSLVNFTTLGNTNSFSNTDRFTAPDGTQIYTDNLIVDNYTGLMIYRILQSSSTWNNAIDNALLSTQGGYSDWFLINRNQLESFSNLGNGSNRTFNYSPLNENTNNQTFTSTTISANTGSMWAYYNNNSLFYGAVSILAKTETKPYFLCRKHF